MRSVPLLCILAALCGPALADSDASPAIYETQGVDEIPTTEREFVEAIAYYDKSRILAQFGEPSKKDDYVSEVDGKVLGSIWHYSYINTSAEGTYYETTELDFVDERVVMVVFINNSNGHQQEDTAKRLSPANGI